MIIAFKGAIRDFLQSPHSAANCLQHARSSGPGAIVCKSRPTHPALKSHLFELYFVGWIIKPMKEGRKPEYPEKTPGDELQKMPHTTAWKFKPQARLEPTQ